MENTQREAELRDVWGFIRTMAQGCPLPTAPDYIWRGYCEAMRETARDMLARQLLDERKQRIMATNHKAETPLLERSEQVSITGYKSNRVEGLCMYCGREDFHNEVCPNFVDDDYTS